MGLSSLYEETISTLKQKIKEIILFLKKIFLLLLGEY